MGWQREFEASPSPWCLIKLAPGYIILGIVLCVAYFLWQTPDCLMSIGFMCIVATIHFVWSRHFSTNCKIICIPSGFSVTTNSRARGTHQHLDYRWSEVSKTKYGVRQIDPDSS